MTQKSRVESHIETIRRVLSRFPEVEEALLFGSRAKGTNRPGSDLDLAVKGNNINAMSVARIQAEMDETNLPFRVDLVWYNEDLSTALMNHIDRMGQPIYRKQTSRKLEK